MKSNYIDLNFQPYYEHNNNFICIKDPYMRTVRIKRCVTFLQKTCYFCIKTVLLVFLKKSGTFNQKTVTVRKKYKSKITRFSRKSNTFLWFSRFSYKDGFYLNFSLYIYIMNIDLWFEKTREYLNS